jgi:DNA-binding Lrp family transcriptional regulator
MDLAGRLDTDTAGLLAVLESWERDGILRRFGAIVDHFKVGAGAGAMVVWHVEPERIEQVGAVFAGFEQVSHAYQRKTCENWPFNVYTMVHAADVGQLERTVARMSEASRITNYRVLVTEKELKKVPPTYIK